MNLEVENVNESNFYVMKYLFLVLSVFLFLGAFPIQEKKSLYLVFSQNEERIKKFHFASDKYLTFTYEIALEGKKYKTIALDEVFPLKRDTVKLKKISSLDFKNIDWLTKKYLEYYDYFRGEHPRIDKDGTLKAFDLNKMYESIYIIIPDPSSKKATITKVEYNSSFSID